MQNTDHHSFKSQGKKWIRNNQYTFICTLKGNVKLICIKDVHVNLNKGDCSINDAQRVHGVVEPELLASVIFI